MTIEITAEQLIAEQKEETRGIVEALLADGSDPKASHAIEHHFVSEDFDILEKVAVDCFKAGFEVDDAEELELEDGSIAYCFDAISQHKLDLERLDKDCETLIYIAEKYDVLYDGWGTHFIEI